MTRTKTRANANMPHNIFSVIDFGAVGDNATDDTQAIQDALAALKATAGRGTLYFPPGTYICNRALHLDGRITVQGSGNRSSVLKRTAVVGEDFYGTTRYCMFHIAGGWNHIFDIVCDTEGTIAVGSTTAYQFAEGANLPAKGSLIRCTAIGYYNAIEELGGCFLYIIEGCNFTNCGEGMAFNSDNPKTSLLIRNNYCANTGQPYNFKRVQYSTINGNGADNCNWGNTPGNKYGPGYGLPSSGIGIYNFEQCNATTVANNGTEGSYGNGGMSFSSCNMVVEENFFVNIKSQFEPPDANYAVGILQGGTGPNTLVINGNHDNVNPFVNTVAPNNPQALVFACNYDAQVFGHGQTQAVINGFQGEEVVAGRFATQNTVVTGNSVLTGITSKSLSATLADGASTPILYTPVTHFPPLKPNKDPNLVNGVFTIPLSGFYTINCQAHFRAATTAGSVLCSIIIDGETYLDGNPIFITSDVNVRPTVSATVYLAKDQTVSFTMICGGTTGSIIGNGDWNDLSIVKL